MEEQSVIAFALGGLAGNNAHGAGFLQAALDESVEPAMISCTSGQIIWTYQYLLAKNDKTVDLRRVLQERIHEMKPFNNPDIDTLRLWLQGMPGVFRPAIPEWWQDLAANTADSMYRFMGSFGTASLFETLLQVFPNRFWVPAYTDEFINEICDTLKNSPIGIIFNAYNPVEGLEHIYMNDVARTWLARSNKDRAKYIGGTASSYREGSSYQDITPQAIRNGLWLYQYGFDRKRGRKESYLDGAYYRQIMLNELTYATHIFAVRPIGLKWIGDLPKSYIEMEDMKTEVGFDGSYAGEKHQINLINKLLKEGSLNPDKYHHIDLHEVAIKVQRGYFDYIYESLDVFDRAVKQSKEMFEETLPMIYKQAA